jgi:hypothetical protein
MAIDGPTIPSTGSQIMSDQISPQDSAHSTTSSGQDAAADRASQAQFWLRLLGVFIVINNGAGVLLPIFHTLRRVSKYGWDSDAVLSELGYFVSYADAKAWTGR